MVSRLSASPVPTAFGDKYLVYTTYPNGYPLLEMSEQQAEMVLHKAKPDTPINRDKYVYGRTRWHGREVGVVVFPLVEDDSRAIDGILQDPNIQEFEKDTKINDMMPGLIAKDTGAFHVYDLSLNQLVSNPEQRHLQGEAHKLDDDMEEDELEDLQEDEAGGDQQSAASTLPNALPPPPPPPPASNDLALAPPPPVAAPASGYSVYYANPAAAVPSPFTAMAMPAAWITAPPGYPTTATAPAMDPAWVAALLQSPLPAPAYPTLHAQHSGRSRQAGVVPLQ